MPPCVTALHHKAFEFELATVAAVGASSFNAQQPMPPALGDFVLEVRLFRQALIGAQTLLGTVELQGAALAAAAPFQTSAVSTACGCATCCSGLVGWSAVRLCGPFVGRSVNRSIT